MANKIIYIAVEYFVEIFMNVKNGQTIYALCLSVRVNKIELKVKPTLLCYSWLFHMKN